MLLTLWQNGLDAMLLNLWRMDLWRMALMCFVKKCTGPIEFSPGITPTTKLPVMAE